MKAGAGYTDVHSHILPGMDDGARDISQALEMLRIAREEDIGTMYATPHFMPGKGCPDRDGIRKALENLRRAAEAEGLQLSLRCGAEYYFRQEVLELMETDGIVPLEGTDCVLTEFGPCEEGKYIRRAVCGILDRGYIPVIAHVERYAALMKKGYEDIREMRRMGALIQINAGSVTGDYGGRAKRDTRMLLREGLGDLLGTDAHSHGKRAPRIQKCADYLYRKLDRGYAERLLFGSALRN